MFSFLDENIEYLASFLGGVKQVLRLGAGFRSGDTLRLERLLLMLLVLIILEAILLIMT